MKKLRVWFNKFFSSAFKIIQRLAKTMVEHRFYVLWSYTSREFFGFELVAASFIEPQDSGGEESGVDCFALAVYQQYREFVLTNSQAVAVR